MFAQPRCGTASCTEAAAKAATKATAKAAVKAATKEASGRGGGGFQHQGPKKCRFSVSGISAKVILWGVGS